MHTEFEIKFLSVDYEKLTTRLLDIGAVKIKEKVLMKRVVYHKDGEKNTYLRIRDEGDQTTVTLKKIENDTDIYGVKEINVNVESFESMKEIFENFGMEYTAYQENYREKWIYNNVEICIDEWPGINPFVEIEGDTEDLVRDIVNKLGFVYEDGIFGAVDNIYEIEAGIKKDIINKINLITFENPPVSIFEWR